MSLHYIANCDGVHYDDDNDDNAIIYRLVLQFIHHESQMYEWMYIASTAIGMLPLLYSSIICIFIRHQIDIHVPLIISITGAIASQDYFDGSLVVSLFLSAELMEAMIMFGVRKAVQLSSAGTIPSHAILVDGTKVPVYDIKVGDKLAVRTGEMILADGKVIKGECVVDESALTGECIPIQKIVGDIVRSGTVVQNGYIEVVVDVASSDSTMQR